ncbi:calmodulin [Denitrobaculum tricleocarpae]|uniref:Calmodulin n=1 Tax=Denitrobaculum tricleocarpae TaxID=2591009 RepID=A0A545SXN9_9PROT|nr:calmodulin [Denitrobaculum tricleocarpae]TQV69724.1 calmodulin [Denitrobaculum tricleocarpae]
MKKVLGVALISLFASSAAYAATFAEADADASGAVSAEEAASIMPNLTEDIFKAADADGSGDLSEAEFSTIPQ